MADLALIVPTRGRPERFAEMLQAIADTATTPVTVYAGVDDDDDVPAYKAATPAAFLAAPDTSLATHALTMTVGPRLKLSPKTNELALYALQRGHTHLASLGDDHRPRTQGWDVKLCQAAESVGGWAYGNDLLQGGRLPTAWVVTADLTRKLGWLMLPACEHMYVDNAVLELGRRTRRIAYVPSVVVEHQHPLGGHAEWDDSYRESNSDARYAADRASFEGWLADGIDTDIAAIGVRE